MADFTRRVADWEFTLEVNRSAHRGEKRNIKYSVTIS